MSERAQALEQANYFLDAIDEIATIGAAPKHHTGQSAMPPPYNMTPSTAKNIKWNTREIRSKLALLASAAPPVGVSPQPDEADALEVRIDLRRPTPTWDEVRAYAKALAYVKAERDELQALAGAILRSVRDDAHGEQWTIRKFLDDRGVYNDNLSGSRRLVEEACKKVIGGYDSPPASLSPVEPTPERAGYNAAEVMLDPPAFPTLTPVEPAPPTPAPCVWREDVSGDFWESSCGETWTFTDGGPAENKARFCHGCGHPIEAIAHIDSIEDDE